MTVRQWPTYLLRGIPEETRAAIEEDAELNGVALIEIIRSAICSYYALDCQPVHSSPRPPTKGTGTMVLRLQPELWEAIRADAGEPITRGAIDKIIHQILAEHYAPAVT